MSARRWVYTINNYLELDIVNVQSWEALTHVCAREVGESGTPHLQGYIKLASTKRLAGMKSLCDRAHWEIAKGNEEQCVAYCRKDGNMIVDKVAPNEQGKRSDLLKIRDEIIKGTSLRNISLMEDHFETYVRYKKSLDAIRASWLPKRQWKMEVIVRWGPPRTGKSSYVWKTHGVDNVFKKQMGHKWWHSYQGEPVVLIDEFHDCCKEMNFHYMLDLLDEHPLEIEVKGGHTNFCSRIIYLTSNKNPRSWFSCEEHRNAFFERITKITYVTKTRELDQPAGPFRPIADVLTSVSEVGGVILGPPTPGVSPSREVTPKTMEA